MEKAIKSDISKQEEKKLLEQNTITADDECRDNEQLISSLQEKLEMPREEIKRILKKL